MFKLLARIVCEAVLCEGEEVVAEFATGSYVQFDGRRLHATAESEGTRYSLVAFQHSAAEEFTQTDLEELCAMWDGALYKD